ncbi:transglutaminaseTgpA domain-containing protein [Microbacterium sp. ARD32]|uniref:transglutaminaseTgpA domain-containing protein n=1 Tax=Microbacterium sp. ARD32 TaxID=2962577 RepID=UPI00288153A4|nr:transglutaminaseTgpA domain-containing protein [Microbacterium sp. ARD32]MDT0156119.1 transglutaminaseTgpA domain-containing protein [Microbacterium sp. ARD32]
MTSVPTSTATPLPLRRWILDLSATAVLLLVALIGFWPSFAGPSFLVAAVGGMLLGLAIAAVCALKRWGILIVAGFTIAAYFLFGGALALPGTTLIGVVPTLETLQGLALGAVTAWKQLLTTVAPVSPADGHLVVVLIVALVASATTASLALRLRQVWWALIPAASALLLVIGLGVPDPAFPLTQGVIFAAVAVVWMSLRTWWAPQSSAVDVSEIDPGRAAHMRTRRMLSGVAVLAVAGLAGAGLGAIAQPGEPRHVFRDAIVPPFNIRDYPSPLQAFRKNVRDEADKTLFTVTGLPEGARVRLAAMDDWDGIVYNVTDGGPGTSSAFSPLRSNMAAGADGQKATLRFDIGDYSGVWVPGTQGEDQITFEGSRAERLRRSGYHNTATGTTVVTEGLQKGDTYTVDAVLPKIPTDEELGDTAIVKMKLPELHNVPEELSTLAAETVTEAKTPIGQVRALQTYLSKNGFFSHGLGSQAHLSRAGHTAERIATLVGGEQMIGDDEQYAVTMALMAREIGIPARVVMGYYPKKESDSGVFKATGDDVHAWVEVNFTGYGWLPFDPTPPEDQEPQDQNTKPRVDPKPQVLQPPPPPQEPVDLPPTVPDDRKPEDDAPNILGIIGVILAIGGISLLTLLILSSPFIVIGAWKASRRRARRNAQRTADRISGGWDELTDRAIDYGARLSPGGTRFEEAATVSAALSLPAATTLADRADDQVFGPDDPSQGDVDAFWAEVDSLVGGLGRQAGFWKRVKARLSLRSLTGRGRISARMQELKDAATARVRREPGNIDSKTTRSESETS